MTISRIQAKTLLRKQKVVDSWFLSRYYLNLYQGCLHNCSYCDGRSENYHVRGEFGKDVGVKVNALEIFQTELDRLHHSRTFRKAHFMLGGGVSDSYQPVEADACLARGILELLTKRPLPVFVLTKSTLVLRDLDLLKRIKSREPVTVAVSISTVDDEVAKQVEPAVASPSKRLALLKDFKAAGLHVGVCLMPVLPGISDSEDHIEQALTAIKAAGAEFVLFGGLTLKSGQQQDHYLELLEKLFPDHLDGYRQIYQGDPWGGSIPQYSRRLQQRFATLAREARIPVRMPRRIFQPFLNDRDLVVILLEHMQYMSSLIDEKSDFGRGAREIAHLTEPLQLSLLDEQAAPGCSAETNQSVREILSTGTCERYEELCAIFS
jgi:DNA repair photolyase